MIGTVLTQGCRLPQGAMHSRHAEAGSALVEFAMIFLLLITLFFGVMGFGQALYAYHFVNNAAKEATRWAAVNGYTCNSDTSCNGAGYMNNGPATQANVATYIQNRVPSGIVAANLTVTACGVSGGGACAASRPTICSTAVGGLGPIPNDPGCTVQVTVTYPFQFPFALLNTIIPAAGNTNAPCTKPGICLSSTSDLIIAH
jgi:Flp pilus assembly protein TadG